MATTDTKPTTDLTSAEQRVRDTVIAARRRLVDSGFDASAARLRDDFARYVSAVRETVNAKASAPTGEPPPEVAEALALAHADGFRGEAVDCSAPTVDPTGAHALYVVQCRFGDDPRTHPYVVAADLHGEPRAKPRLLPLYAVVHVMQNLTEAERWEIEGREHDEDRDRELAQIRQKAEEYQRAHPIAKCTGCGAEGVVLIALQDGWRCTPCVDVLLEEARQGEPPEPDEDRSEPPAGMLIDWSDVDPDTGIGDWHCELPVQRTRDDAIATARAFVDSITAPHRARAETAERERDTLRALLERCATTLRPFAPLDCGTLLTDIRTALRQSKGAEP